MPGSTTLTKFYYTYVLKSIKDGRRYIGYTTNLRKRMNEHTQGKVWSTAYRRPLQLIYYEACLTPEDAERREKYFKTTGERRFLVKRLKVYLSEI